AAALALGGTAAWFISGHTVPLEHILDYLRDHLARNWAVVGRTQIKDDTLGLLALMEKAHRAGTGRR
ncbi:MAG: hypothetical protein V7768_05710, partial [Dietzia cercidiphylli]